MQGGTFTVSNLGMYGITTFTPVLNPPEAAILGIGGMRNTLARGSDNEIKDTLTLDISLTLDHRVIDGAQGALFLESLAQHLEKPATLLL